MEEMVKLAEKAVAMAKAWNMELDYSAESLETVDKLAQTIFNWNRSDPLPEDALLNTADLFGAYLGEVLLRCGLKDLDYAWTDNDEGETGIGKEDVWMAPITKVYKRITAGPEHNLMSFFEVMFGYAIGAINLDDPRVHILSVEEET